MSKNILITPKYDTESHSEYAYRIIRENIMQLKLLPGSQLNEANLAKALNISRTPVHEAVNRLKEENLVDVIPRKESRISHINISLLNEGIFMRCAIEPDIIKLVAGNLPTSYIKKFRQNLEMQKEILDSNDNLFKFYEIDDQFHKMIYDVANKSNIYNYMRKVVGHLDRIRYLVRFDGNFAIESISYEEHNKLFSFLMFGLPNEVDIDAFFKKHIMRFQKCMPVLVEKYSDYFSL